MGEKFPEPGICSANAIFVNVIAQAASAELRFVLADEDYLLLDELRARRLSLFRQCHPGFAARLGVKGGQEFYEPLPVATHFFTRFFPRTRLKLVLARPQ